MPRHDLASDSFTPQPMLQVLDLFSGLGAYSLGLERTGGFKTAALCEINAYCRRNLKGHWPDATIYEDVEQLTGERLRADGIVPDWIVAGWPCQGNSPAGTGLGMDDPRSGLWAHIARLAGEIRPLGLLLENSSNLLAINDGRDFGRVLGDLAALGYDAEWHCLSAAAFDAPHIRDRVWIVATLADAARDEPRREDERPERERVGAGGQSVTLSDAGSGRYGDTLDAVRPGRNAAFDGCGSERPLADPDREGLSQRASDARWAGGAHGDDPWHPFERSGAVALAYRFAPVGTAIARQQRHTWEPEPDVGRVATGVADRVERIHALGNLNPPIIPESIGRAILASNLKATANAE